MTTPSILEQRIERALSWLVDIQEDDGDVPIFASRRRDLSGHRFLDSSPFNVVHILAGVRACASPRVDTLARGLEAYLWREASDRATWSYFARKSGRQIDDDLDDTACCAAVLRQADPQRDAELAGNVPLLLGNRDAQGRFFTWLRPPEARNDVDAVVNANVLWYLGDRDETQSAATWLCELVAEGDENRAVLYYENRLTLYYAIARALDGGARSLAPTCAPILSRLAALEPEALDVVELAFACSAAQRLRGPEVLTERLLDALLERQDAQGWFPVAPVWNGPEHPAPRSVWWGGEPLSTGLALDCMGWAARVRPT